MGTVSKDVQDVFEELKKTGFLLMTDARLPTVASLVAGQTVRGSWWSHPRAHDIFSVLGQLQDHKDVIFTRLVSGKVTLVHRKLWRDLVTIAVAGEGWQTRGLDSAARHLLHAVKKSSSIESDALSWPRKFEPIKIGSAVRTLELRLLIHTEEFHAASGAHAKLLETWEHWANRAKAKIGSKVPEKSKAVFERLLSALDEEFGGKNYLPWQRNVV